MSQIEAPERLVREEESRDDSDVALRRATGQMFVCDEHDPPREFSTQRGLTRHRQQAHGERPKNPPRRQTAKRTRSSSGRRGTVAAETRELGQNGRDRILQTIFPDGQVPLSMLDRVKAFLDAAEGLYRAAHAPKRGRPKASRNGR